MLIDYVINPLGYTVIDSKELTSFATALVLDHINSQAGTRFSNLNSAAQSIEKFSFYRFKEKKNRLLDSKNAAKFLRKLRELGMITVSDFVTDEESLGYPNVNWRIVRANSPSDVGPIHADHWFWDLGAVPFPRTHLRVKVWMPLVQEERTPGLTVLPGSQHLTLQYDYKTDESGKKKPVFYNAKISEEMIPAPVSVGQAIIFNDRLLHGGVSSSHLRVSIEWTIGCEIQSL